MTDKNCYHGFRVENALEGMANYAGLILALAKGSGLWLRLLMTFLPTLKKLMNILAFSGQI